MASPEMQTTATDKLKKQKHRSPNYPVVGLEKAVELLAKLQTKYGTHDVPINLVHVLWDFKEGSGSGNQCVAALKAYGLVKVTGEGDKRKVSLSPEGKRIAMNAPDRAELLKQAVQKPAVHRDILRHYGSKGLPTDDLLKTYLLWERPEGQRFNQDVVDSFISRFRASLVFSGLQPSDTISDDGGEQSQGADDDEGGGDEELQKPTVGDFVQWTCNGVDRFTPPAKVLGISPCGGFAFVRESKAGLPMTQLTVVDPPPSAAIDAPPANPFFQEQGTDQRDPGLEEEKTNLEEGPVVLRWPKKLTKESVEELDYWVQGILRRARRKAGMSPEKTKGETKDKD